MAPCIPWFFVARSMNFAEQDVCLADNAAMIVIMMISLVPDDMSESNALVMHGIGGIASNAARQYNDRCHGQT